MLQTVPSRQTLARKYQQIVVIIQLQHAVEVVMFRREDTLTTSSMFLKFIAPRSCRLGQIHPKLVRNMF